MKTFLNASAVAARSRGSLALVLVFILASHVATQVNAVPANSAEARARIQQYLDRIGGLDTPGSRRSDQSRGRPLTKRRRFKPSETLSSRQALS
jgi:hypothetical protein